jgi:hypothetical protein
MTTNEQWNFTLKLDGVKVMAGASDNRDGATARARHYLAQYLLYQSLEGFNHDKLEFKIWKK